MEVKVAKRYRQGVPMRVLGLAWRRRRKGRTPLVTQQTDSLPGPITLTQNIARKPFTSNKMAFGFRRRNLTRIFLLVAAAILIRLATSSKSSSSRTKSHEIQGHGVLDFVHVTDNALDVRRHAFLQSRMGRDEREDLMSDIVLNGVEDYWEGNQK